MLTHVHILAECSALQARLESILRPLRVELTSAVKARGSIGHYRKSSVDTVIVSYSVLADPVEESIAHIRDHVESPDIVVVWEGE